MKATPGPWFLRSDDSRVWSDRAGAGLAPVADTENISVFHLPEGEAKANANLIAAAPDFYEAATGDEEPDLWNVRTTEIMLRHLRGFLAEVAAGAYPAEDLIAKWWADDEGSGEGFLAMESMCAGLRSALAKARGEA
jgi:hypothetical protein